MTFLTPLEAEAIAAALRPRIEALREMREMQVHCNALQKLRMLQ